MLSCWMPRMIWTSLRTLACWLVVLVWEERIEGGG